MIRVRHDHGTLHHPAAQCQIDLLVVTQKRQRLRDRRIGTVVERCDAAKPIRFVRRSPPERRQRVGVMIAGEQSGRGIEPPPIARPLAECLVVRRNNPDHARASSFPRPPNGRKR